MTRSVIVEIINKALNSQEILSGVVIDRSAGEQTPIFGEGAQVDSMGLVSMIVEVEEDIERQLNATLIIASERAMSARRSPFATIGTFADYICDLLAEVENA